MVPCVHGYCVSFGLRLCLDTSVQQVTRMGGGCHGRTVTTVGYGDGGRREDGEAVRETVRDGDEG